jgi:hypothetical protein
MSDSDDSILAGGWTRAKLAARSPEERHGIWKNARAKATPEALELAAVIEDLGIFTPGAGGLKMDDPLTLRMFDIINSAKGRAACIEATDKGQPAIAGVDPMLRATLGEQYSGENRATVAAGVLVGELMRMLGYQHAGERQMPVGSVATRAAIWLPRK